MYRPRKKIDQELGFDVHESAPQAASPVARSFLFYISLRAARPSTFGGHFGGLGGLRNEANKTLVFNDSFETPVGAALRAQWAWVLPVVAIVHPGCTKAAGGDLSFRSGKQDLPYRLGRQPRAERQLYLARHPKIMVGGRESNYETKPTKPLFSMILLK
jgi:hypothetical protein